MSGVYYWREFRKEGNGNGSFGHVWLAWFQLPNRALLNVTVDNLSPLITYQGEWEPASSHVSDYDWGGNHALSSDEEASATFIFTGAPSARVRREFA
jgi:hypothetical protein